VVWQLAPPPPYTLQEEANARYVSDIVCQWLSTKEVHCLNIGRIWAKHLLCLPEVEYISDKYVCDYIALQTSSRKRERIEYVTQTLPTPVHNTFVDACIRVYSCVRFVPAVDRPVLQLYTYKSCHDRMIVGSQMQHQFLNYEFCRVSTINPHYLLSIQIATQTITRI